MSKVSYNLDLTSAAAASDYLTVGANQPVFVSSTSWGSGGSVTINFSSIINGATGTEVALTTDLNFTSATVSTGRKWVAPVAGKLRAKVTTTGASGNAVGEISTDAARSW